MTADKELTIDATDDDLEAGLVAARAMFSVLVPIIQSGALDDNLADLKRDALAAVAQAEAAGITPTDPVDQLMKAEADAKASAMGPVDMNEPGKRRRS